LSPGLSIQKVNVYVNKVQAGSLKEDVLVKFIWGNQEKFDQGIDQLRKTLKVDDILQNRLLVGAIIGALIIGGGLHLLHKFDGSEDQKEILRNTQNVFIFNGVAQSGVGEKEFKTAIDDAIARNQKLPKDAIRAIRPAKRDPKSTITLNNDKSATIGTAAVQAMPSSTPDDDQKESVEDFSNVEIRIRAIDLDSTKRGWAAVLPSISSRRAKMHLDPNIKLTDLIGKTAINGDVTIIFKNDEAGDRYPSLIFLRNIRK
jgi:hypothetical protein